MRNKKSILISSNEQKKIYKLTKVLLIRQTTTCYISFECDVISDYKTSSIICIRAKHLTFSQKLNSVFIIIAYKLKLWCWCVVTWAVFFSAKNIIFLKFFANSCHVSIKLSCFLITIELMRTFFYFFSLDQNMIIAKW